MHERRRLPMLVLRRQSDEEVLDMLTAPDLDIRTHATRASYAARVSRFGVDIGREALALGSFTDTGGDEVGGCPEVG